MRSRRLRTRAVATAVTLALLVLGSGQAFAHTAEPPQYTAVDLGTLGGSGSYGVALDRDTVVGNSETFAGGTDWHAFAYDRSTHVMTDLGTLGGSSSSAVAVQGRYVIGNASLADGNRRGFVYDLRTGQMRALGTLGGTDSQVRAISGHIVVGNARTAGNQTHAFVYDIRTDVMTDLGTPAGPAGVSSPIGISQGRFVAGTWNVPGAMYDGGQPFVYDLRTRVMTDVGAHGGVYSKATSFSGHTIVGITQPKPSSDTGELPPTHGFAYDIRTRTWTDLGAEMSYQPLVTGHTVVASNRPAAYAYDLTSQTMTPFGPGPGRTGIDGVGGRFVVGETFPGPYCYVYRIDTRRLT
jgi:probable HAF family extracellular repeat protein